MGKIMKGDFAPRRPSLRRRRRRVLKPAFGWHGPPVRTWEDIAPSYFAWKISNRRAMEEAQKKREAGARAKDAETQPSRSGDQ
jgi:hypothetical protein